MTTVERELVAGRTRAITHTRIVPKAAKLAARYRAAAGEPGDDGWCENGSKCTAYKDRFNSVTKGNAAYGDQSGVLGTFDINIHTSLNGRSPRVKGVFYWDSGPRIVFHNTQIQVIEDQAVDVLSRASYVDGPDGNGSFAIGPNDGVDRGPWINFKPLKDSNPYWNQVKGKFEAYYVDFVIGVLKTPKYRCFSDDPCYFPDVG